MNNRGINAINPRSMSIPISNWLTPVKDWHISRFRRHLCSTPFDGGDGGVTTVITTTGCQLWLSGSLHFTVRDTLSLFSMEDWWQIVCDCVELFFNARSSKQSISIKYVICVWPRTTDTWSGRLLDDVISDVIRAISYLSYLANSAPTFVSVDTGIYPHLTSQYPACDEKLVSWNFQITNQLKTSAHGICSYSPFISEDTGIYPHLTSQHPACD